MANHTKKKAPPPPPSKVREDDESPTRSCFAAPSLPEVAVMQTGGSAKPTKTTAGNGSWQTKASTASHTSRNALYSILPSRKPDPPSALKGQDGDDEGDESLHGSDANPGRAYLPAGLQQSGNLKKTPPPPQLTRTETPNSTGSSRSNSSKNSKNRGGDEKPWRRSRVSRQELAQRASAAQRKRSSSGHDQDDYDGSDNTGEEKEDGYAAGYYGQGGNAFDSGDEDGGDGGSVSSVETEDGTGVIAIGLLVPGTSTTIDKPNPEAITSTLQSEDKATQQAVSQLKEEDKTEKVLITPSISSGALSSSRRSSTRSTFERNSSAHSTVASVSSSASAPWASADGLSQSDQDAKRSAGGPSLIQRRPAPRSGKNNSANNEAAVRAAKERAKQEQMKAVPGPALAPGTSSSVGVAAGFAAVDDVGGDNSHGPSIAGGFASASKPGAVPSQQPRHSKDLEREDAGPSLAPPAQLSGSTSTTAAVAPATTSSATRNSNNDDDALEVETGVHIGAFAIDGMESGQAQPMYDSDLEDDDVEGYRRQLESSNAFEEPQPSIEITEAHLAGEEGPTPLEAELQVVADGVIITDDDEDYDSPKALRRLRMIQSAIVCFSCFALALILGAVFGFSRSDSTGNAVQPPLWVPAGPEMYGPPEEPQTLFGQAVAISGNGTRLVAAAPGSDQDRIRNIGQVRVLDEVAGDNGTDWTVTKIIEGPESSEEAKASVDLSLDGSRLVVGHPRQVSGGSVEIYEEDIPSLWISMGNLSLPAGGSTNVDQQSENDVSSWFGHSVALTPDGETLAVGAPLYTSPSLSEVQRTGLVRMYQYDQASSEWWQLGDDLVGQGPNEFLGWSVAVAKLDNGSIRLAAGGPAHDAETGLVRVMDWTGSVWQSVAGGDSLVGDQPLDRFGESVDLSQDGTVLAVGARGTAFEPGSVKVYRLNSADNGGQQWVADSTTNLVGDEPAEGFGASVALSGDGGVLAVGSPEGGTSGSGLVQMMHYNSTLGFWEDVGPAIGGFPQYQPQHPGGALGSAVAMTTNGQRVLVGAPSTTFDGSIAEAGMVRVYDRISKEDAQAAQEEIEATNTTNTTRT